MPNVEISTGDLLALLRERRSIRRYQAAPVHEDMIGQMLEAARWAPSANNSQPWRFIVVRDPVIREQIAQSTTYVGEPRVRLNESPVLIVLCGVEDHAYHAFLQGDVAMAALQMMLQAKALGLGTCWVGGLDRAALGGLLQIPNALQVIGLLTVGFPAESPEPQPRKPLEELVHHDRYGVKQAGEHRIPGVPDKAPPGPGTRAANWLRRVFRRPV